MNGGDELYKKISTPNRGKELTIVQSSHCGCPLLEGLLRSPVWSETLLGWEEATK